MRVVIASGKGGTGKTFVATNLFQLLRERGTSVAIADADAEVPNSLAFLGGELLSKKEVTQYLPIIKEENCTFCGKCAEWCYYNALFVSPQLKKIKLLEELCHGCGACEVACQFDAIEESHKVIGEVSLYQLDGGAKFAEARLLPGEPSPVPVIKEGIKEITKEGAKITIVDAPPGTSCPFVESVSGADYLILVAEPTPFGVSDLNQTVETLRVLDIPFGVVINRAGIGDEAIYHYLKEQKIELLAEIPYSREIAELYSVGELSVTKVEGLKERFENIIEKLEKYGDSSN